MLKSSLANNRAGRKRLWTEDDTTMIGTDRPAVAGMQDRRLLVVAAVLIALLASLAFARPAGAHAFLESSDPSANAVLSATPQRVTMRFSEPLEHVARTKATLYDQVGQLVSGPTHEFDDSDPYVMILVLPT